MKKGWKALVLWTALLLLLAMGTASAADQLEGGEDQAHAAQMAIFGNYLVSMDVQEAEWFVFQADEDPAYYWANLTNQDLNTTLYMTLYDKDGLKIAEVDANQGQYDYISWKAAPGETYYLRFVRRHGDRHGRFTLHLDKAADVYANELENAAELKTDEKILTSFDGSHDVDFFRFKAAEGAAYYRVDYKNENIGTDVYMTLYDKNGLKIDEVRTTKGNSNYYSWNVVPGETYYLKFSRHDGYRGGDYTLTLKRFADAQPNEMGKGVALELDKPVQASFDGSNDVDFFQFKAAEGAAYYQANYKNENINTDVYMTLYDKDGLKIGDARASNGNSNYYSWNVVPGETYYLKFSRHDGYRGGNYTLTLKRFADAQPNEMEKGTELKLDTTVQASFDGSHDIDFFQVTAEEGAAYYRVDYKNENVNTTMYMTLLDKNGTQLAVADASQGQNDYLSWQITPGETYYLKFSRHDGYRGGMYTISTKRYADNEPNGMENVQEMARQQPINASFDGSHDVDFFKFTTKAASTNYQINFKNENINTTMYVELLDENGLSLLRTEAGNGRTGWLNWYTAEEKTYYLKCYRHDAYRGGQYTLEMRVFEDTEQSSLENAPLLKAGEEEWHSLGAREDQDFFLLSPAENPVYTWMTLGNQDSCGRMYLAVLNGAGTELASWRVDGGQMPSLLIPQSAEKLHLRVTGDAAGLYTLTRQDQPDMGGMSRETAMKAAAAKDGELILEINNDVDFLAFPCAGASLLLTSDPNTTVYVTLMDQNGQIILNETRIRGNESFLFTADREQAYLQIKGNAGSLHFACCTPDQHVASEYWQEIFAPTCKENGLRQMMCTVCRQAAKEEILPALPHQAGEWQLLRHASCDDTGLEARYCKDCGTVMEEKEIPASGHLHSHWEVAAMPTCEGEGLQFRVCDDCGKLLSQEIIPATGHVTGEWYTKSPAYCETEGLRILPCKICKNTLEEEILPALGHQLSDWLVQRQPSCESDGLQVKICQTCYEDVEQEILPATGHLAGEWQLQWAAACEADGLQVKFCQYCAHILEEETIPALLHEAGEWQILSEPGCEAEGLQIKICIHCGKTMEQEILPALGHAYGEWVEVVAPTRNEEGREESTCAHCGHVQSRPIKKLSLMESIFGR